MHYSGAISPSAMAYFADATIGGSIATTDYCPFKCARRPPRMRAHGRLCNVRFAPGKVTVIATARSRVRTAPGRVVCGVCAHHDGHARGAANAPATNYQGEAYEVGSRCYESSLGQTINGCAFCQRGLVQSRLLIRVDSAVLN